MTDTLSAMASKIAPLLRMLSSSADGEVINAARALLRLLTNAGLDIHVLVERIETPPLSEDDMKRIFDAGREQGRAEESEQRRRSAAAVAVASPFANGVGDGINGYSWREVVGHCAINMDRILIKWESDFIVSVAEQLTSSYYDTPTEKQALIVRRIFLRWFNGKI